MRLSVRAHHLACGALLLALAACDAASGVEVQPLPPANRLSAAARAGLPDVEGTWHFAGWELPTATALPESASSLVRPGDFVVQFQKLDSIAGSYTADGVRFPVIGEVRRDRRIALVAFAPDGQSSYAAGEVRNDTLWVELTSFAAAESWPVGTRAAWVQGTPAAPFLRLPGVPTAPVAGDTVDTVAAPQHPAASVAPAMPTPSAQTAPPATVPATSADTGASAPSAPRPVAPQTPQTPKLLGTPVQRPTPAQAPTPAAPRPVPPPDTIATPPPPEPGAR